MRSRLPASPRPGFAPGLRSPRRLQSTRAFSLLELSVVLFIISLVAALGVPALRRVYVGARTTAVLNDLRVFTGAFQSYAHDRGDWPEATGVPGEFPSGMQNYLSATNWERPSPIGGAYTWSTNSWQQGERCRAVIVLATVGANRVTAEREQLVDIDRKIDDGNLATGNFRLGYRDQPIWVIEH